MNARIFHKRYPSQVFRNSNFSLLGKKVELKGKHYTCLYKEMVMELMALYSVIWPFTF